MKNRCLFLLGALALAGCQTLEKTLKSADGALDVINSGTVKNVARIAGSDDPGATLRHDLKERGEYYKENPAAALEDMRAVKRDFDRLMALLRGNAGKQWGKQEARVPTRKQYVKYTQNYLSRAVVDFDSGEIMVETLDEANPDESLRNAIVTTLLTPDDPRAVDLFSDQAVTLSSAEEPYLKGLVLDHKGAAIADPPAAEAYARHLLGTARKQRTIEVDGARKQASYVQFSMVGNFSNQQARKYSALVERHAARYNVSPSLVYAIIRTESNFNPYAVSVAPAYGLMQLVPASGGRDAYRRVTGSDGIPSKEYLFDAGNNIELGTAYLNVLAYNHLDGVQNEISREYCVISAYNTGAGNVLKAFAPERSAAVNAINRQQPGAVYAQLRARLPYEETRQYLEKVVNYRRQFVAPVN